MKDQVAVIGVGCTKFGDRFERSYEELITDAAFDAYADAGIDSSEIEAAYLGTYLPGAGGGKAAVSLGDALRLYDRPITRVENYCATGTDAFRNGCLAVAAGVADVVLVLGAEKLKDRGGRARLYKKDPVFVKGVGLAVTTGRPYFDPTFDYLGFRSTQAAARQAYAMAGVGPRDIDFAEVHDCFTWTEISNTEDLGCCAKGEGGRLVEEGRTALDGDIPVNPSGGLKSFGHPIGASGVRMIYECVTQLRGEAGARQVKQAELGLAHNVGGPGAVSCVVVLGRG